MRAAYFGTWQPGSIACHSPSKKFVESKQALALVGFHAGCITKSKFATPLAGALVSSFPFTFHLSQPYLHADFFTSSNNNGNH